MLKRNGAILLGTAALIAGCGSSSTKTVIEQSHAPSTASTASVASTDSGAGLTKPEAAKQYLTLAGPVNSALNKMQTQFGASTDSTTASQLGGYAKPAIAALTTGDGKLSTLASQYPPAATDLKTVIADDAAVVNDLNQASSLDASSVEGWVSQLRDDAGKLSGAVAVVRGDLGLPQRSS